MEHLNFSPGSRETEYNSPENSVEFLVEVREPCLVCGTDTEININLKQEVTESSEGIISNAEIDHRIFRSFLKWFRVDIRRTQKQRLLNRGWDGEDGDILRFCENCKVELIELLEHQKQLIELEKRIKSRLVGVKGKMEKSEEEFQVKGIYERDKRFEMVRNQIVYCDFENSVFEDDQWPAEIITNELSSEIRSSDVKTNVSTSKLFPSVDNNNANKPVDTAQLLMGSHSGESSIDQLLGTPGEMTRKTVQQNENCRRSGRIAQRINEQKINSQALPSKLKHRPPKRFKCTEPNCGEQFRSISNLRKHKKFVHGIMIFWECTTCPKMFAWKDNCERHMKRCSDEEDSKPIKPKTFRGGRPIQMSGKIVMDNLSHRQLVNKPARRPQRKREIGYTDSMKEWSQYLDDNQIPAKIVEPSVKTISTHDVVSSRDHGNGDTSTGNGAFLMRSSSAKYSADQQLVSNLLDVIPNTTSVITSSADQPPCDTSEKSACNQAFPEIEKSVFENGIQRYMFDENDQAYEVQILRDQIVKYVAINSVQHVQHSTDSQPVEINSGIRSSVIKTNVPTSIGMRTDGNENGDFSEGLGQRLQFLHLQKASTISNSSSDQPMASYNPGLRPQSESVVTSSEKQIASKPVQIELQNQVSTTVNENNELNENNTGPDSTTEWTYELNPSAKTITLANRWTFFICSDIQDMVKCTSCNISSSSDRESMCEHIKTYHFNSFVCTQCPYRFVSKLILKWHTHIYHDGPYDMTKLLCEFCGKLVFSLKAHKWTHMSIEEQDEIGRTKPKRIPKSLKNRNWQCLICDKSYTRHSNLVKHMANLH